MQTAIAGKADGIAVAIIDKVAFDAPTHAAMSKGIPVISYNADGGPNTPQTNGRLAYIGQDLYQLRLRHGPAHCRAGAGSGHIGLFIATPGSLNIQPRIDGAKAAIKASNKNHL